MNEAGESLDLDPLGSHKQIRTLLKLNLLVAGDNAEEPEPQPWGFSCREFICVKRIDW